MFSIYLKISDLLSTRERRNAILLFCMMLVMGLLDVGGVASILPFISVVTNPGLIQSNNYLLALYNKAGFTNANAFLLFLGVVVFALVVTSLGFKALTHWAIARYAHMRNYSLSSRLLNVYLNRPYSWFLNRHSSDLGKSILSEVGQVITGAIMPAVLLVANTIVASFLIILIIIIKPVMALVAVGSVGGAYALIYIFLRKYLNRIGVDRVVANQQRFQVAQEALGGIKDVKVIGLESRYVRAFGKPARRFALRQASKQVASEMPRFLLEGLGFGGMIALILFLLATNSSNLSAVMPMIALYAFAGYRLIPAIQQIYLAVSHLRFTSPALDALHHELTESGWDDSKLNRKSLSLPAADRIICLQKRIELRDIFYTYPKTELPILKDFNLKIKAKTTVALVGSTGAGKTTIIDLILGLLIPEEGELLVDDIPITENNMRAWQSGIGYVSQHIFLFDDTVKGNIALGIPEEEIDMAAVESAARVAELHDFVIDEMPQGYDTMVGERGVRLSGGQRQRIGIARALYIDPEVLILDEATSALDNLTERAVMDSVHTLGKKKTIILIAHRLTTVRGCDTIFFLEHGRLVASGTYDELIASCESFKAMTSFA